MRHEDAAWPGPQQQRRADLERKRAARSAALAASYEAQAERGQAVLRPMHARLGALYRRMEERHLASAQLHCLLAAKMERWADSSDGALRPVFLAAVASALGVSSALAVLHGQQHGAAVMGASDRTARGMGDLAVVHQAAGMVSVHCDCSIADAQDLLGMRAFAEGVPVVEIAMQVVTGQTRFD